MKPGKGILRNDKYTLLYIYILIFFDNFAVRLGYPVMTTDYIGVRRDVEDFTSLNGFNNKFIAND